jgi:hypothetical protein
MSIKREGLDALAYELHLLGFGLDEIQDIVLNPQLRKLGDPSLTDRVPPSKNGYFNNTAKAIKRGINSSPKCKQWAVKMLPKCLGQNGKLKSQIVLDYHDLYSHQTGQAMRSLQED